MKPKLNLNMQLKRMDDDFVAFSKKTKEAYKLAPLAFYIATLCDGKRTTGQIAGQIEGVLKKNKLALPFTEDKLIEEVERIINLLSTQGVLLVPTD